MRRWQRENKFVLVIIPKLVYIKNIYYQEVNHENCKTFPKWSKSGSALA